MQGVTRRRPITPTDIGREIVELPAGVTVAIEIWRMSADRAALLSVPVVPLTGVVIDLAHHAPKISALRHAPCPFSNSFYLYVTVTNESRAAALGCLLTLGSIGGFARLHKHQSDFVQL